MTALAGASLHALIGCGPPRPVESSAQRSVQEDPARAAPVRDEAPAASTRARFDDCVIEAGGVSWAEIRRKSPDGRLDEVSCIPICSIRAVCTAQSGIETPGDDAIYLRCRDEDCNCHLRPNSETLADVSFDFQAPCTTEEAARQLLLDRCMAAMR